jgi:hypothetical protein
MKSLNHEKNNKEVAVIVILIIGIFYISTIRKGHYWGGDFSQYIHHAKNISEGKSYKDIKYIVNPHYEKLLSPETYPPIFPLVLAPVYKYFNLDLTVMKSEIILFFLMALYLIYLIFYQKLTSLKALILIIILAVNPYFWNNKDFIHLDFVFIFFVYLSIYLIEIQDNLRSKNKPKYLYSILIGITIYLATGTKGLGLTLMVSYLIHDLIKYKSVHKMTLVTLAFFIFLISFQYHFIHNDFSYLRYLELNPLIWISNFLGYLKANLLLWENGWINFPRDFISILFYVFFIVGFYSRIKKNITLLDIFLIVVLISLSMYKYIYSQFLMIILPIMFFNVICGVDYLSNYFKSIYKKYIVLLMLVVIFSGYALYYSHQDYGPINEGVETKNAISLFENIRKITTEDAIFVFFKPRVLSLYTNRKSSIYHHTDDSSLLKYLRTIHTSFIITGPISDTIRENRPNDIDFIEYLQDFVERNSNYFELVYENEEFKVYRFIDI